MDPWLRDLFVLESQNTVHSSDAFRSLDLVLFGRCECCRLTEGSLQYSR